MFASSPVTASIAVTSFEAVLLGGQGLVDVGRVPGLVGLAAGGEAERRGGD